MVRKVVVKKLVEPSDEKFQLWMDQLDAIDVIAEKNGLFNITRDWDPDSYTVRVECSAPKASNIVNTIMEINTLLSGPAKASPRTSCHVPSPLFRRSSQRLYTHQHLRWWPK